MVSAEACQHQTGAGKSFHLIKHLLKRGVGFLKAVALGSPAFGLGYLLRSVLSVQGR